MYNKYIIASILIGFTEHIDYAVYTVGLVRARTHCLHLLKLSALSKNRLLQLLITIIGSYLSNANAQLLSYDV